MRCNRSVDESVYQPYAETRGAAKWETTSALHPATSWLPSLRLIKSSTVFLNLGRRHPEAFTCFEKLYLRHV